MDAAATMNGHMVPPQANAQGGSSGVSSVFGPMRSASLYVGDLAVSTSESQLFEAFSQIGKIQSIRILRDAITRQSLGYAYVNYYDTGDAERAIDVLNFQPINNRPCRVMWVQRDPYLRKTGVGNVVIKNLAPSIDNKTLFDTFSVFGNILSCKVVTDEEGRSKGFGFVHFDSESSAQGCIADVNGKIIEGREVVVEPFKRGHKTETLWTNLYVKNIPSEWDDEKLYKVFAPYGEITSAVVRKDDLIDPETASSSASSVTDGEKDKENLERGVEKAEKKKEGEDGSIGKEKGGEEGEKEKAGREEKVQEGEKMYKASDGSVSSKASKGFGFVNFVEHESARKAMEDLHGKRFQDGDEEKELYVRRLQTKKERQKELRDKHAQIKKDRLTKFQGCNLYIKNLDESLNDEWLRTNFGKFGTITSARVMRDPQTGASKGFGFVCFSTPEEASNAISKMNTKMFMGKPIYVALSQVASQRREMLAVSFQQQTAQRGGMAPAMAGAPYYPPPQMGIQQPPYMPMPYGQPIGRPGMMGPGRGMPLNPGMMRPMYRMPDYRRPDVGMETPRSAPKRFQQPAGPGGRRGPPNRMMGPPQPPMGPPLMHGPPQPDLPPGPPPPPYADADGAAAAPGGGMIDVTRLASASVEEQKTILGEQLYPLIVRREPALAGKITGMILELDNTEILHLLESPDSLDEKVQEAIKVLHEFHAHGAKDSESG